MDFVSHLEVFWLIISPCQAEDPTWIRRSPRKIFPKKSSTCRENLRCSLHIPFAIEFPAQRVGVKYICKTFVAGIIDCKWNFIFTNIFVCQSVRKIIKDQARVGWVLGVAEIPTDENGKNLNHDLSAKFLWDSNVWFARQLITLKYNTRIYLLSFPHGQNKCANQIIFS